MTLTAVTSVGEGINQGPPRADLAPSLCCARGLHSVCAHHTEPRKTCSRVRGFCNSAIMKREFVQPCAGQNSEFTSPPSPKKHVPVRQGQNKKKQTRDEVGEEEKETEEEEKHTESTNLNLNILNDQNKTLTHWKIKTKLFLKSQV